MVTGIEDHGSIVIMRVEDRDGAEALQYFDRRMFGQMFEAEDGNVVHREVEIRGSFPDSTVEFDPDPEWADVEQDQVAP
jgi:hypothetical protein